MARMLRKTREFRMLGDCACCVKDASALRFRRKWRQQMRRRARRSEERRWIKEVRRGES